MSRHIQMTVNGQQVGPVEVPEGLKMIEFLHEYLNLTGTKFGCGVGVCHACTVIVEGKNGVSEVVRSCISGVERFAGKKVRTIEGHAKRNEAGEITELSPVQMAFLEHFSFQCGWCTSGFVNETTALMERLAKNPVAVSDVEQVVEEALKEHICRCTGYVKYYQGVKALILNTRGLTY
ncbi:(2Fe-2S)-binding protein [Thalassomonas viridans]|uniref:(2Fe-2S)-binding protein n=1 Tax=Thalassomonas viridans TaxID=137584 RepID=A0AAF0C9Z9_9GAMM|nr:(2Fe-2S)-binding protein [Thalassomonas viridans]WDE05760.1 (2Fe-2S)-binding protein [Thalassomonas viridans]